MNNNPDAGLTVTEKQTDSLFINEDQAKGMDQVNDMDRVGDILGNWHNQQMNTLNHVLDMPPNEDPENPELGIMVYQPEHEKADQDGFRPLSEDEWPAFMFGIRFARDLIEDFPIKFVPLDADGNVTAEYASQVQEDNTGGDNAPTQSES